MVKEKIINLLMVSLTVLAVYLTSQLWFGNLSKNDLFYAFNNRANENLVVLQDNYTILKPFRVFVKDEMIKAYYKDGNNLFCDAVLKNVIKKGVFVDEKEFNIKDYSDKKFIMYEYTFDVSADFFSAISGIKSSNFTSKTKNFNQILFFEEEENITVVFNNLKDNVATYYTIKNDFNDSLNNYINEYNKNIDNVFYELSGKKQINSQLIPKWSGESLNYDMVRSLNPYSPSGELVVTDIEALVDYFFNYRDYQFIKVNNIYTFSNETTVVRYYPNDVLEYSDYSSSSDKKKSSNVAFDFFSATAFLLKDLKISNDYYLSNVELKDDINTFYFNYTINNYPLFFSEKMRDYLNMDYFIKVEVENGHVKNFKKLVYNYEIEPDYKEDATISFENTFDNFFMQKNNDEPNVINKLYLAYRAEKNKHLNLNWFVNVDGASSVFPAKYNEKSDK